MFKKIISYSDFDGNDRTDTLYFNLSTTEFYSVMQELNSSDLEALANSGNVLEMLKLIQSFVLAAYGEKSPDGKRFSKNSEIREAFAQSAAYDALIEDFLTNGDSAYAFIRGLIPVKLSEAMAANGISFDSLTEKVQNGTIANVSDLHKQLNVPESNLTVL